MRAPSEFSSIFVIATMFFTFVNVVRAESLVDSLSNVEDRWASATYETDDKQKGRDMRKLLDTVRSLHESHPETPEAAAWHGIVAQSYMDLKPSLSIAKEARDALLHAEAIDPLALDGRIYAHLGALYSKAPSRFGGFGNKTRGIGYLWKAITVDPNGIDANYLYAELLYKEKNYAAARDALLRAYESPTRPEHPKADDARKLEVRNLLAVVEQKLGDQG